MSRPRTGSITEDEKRGGFIVRLTYHDELGKRRDLRRAAENKTAAIKLLDKLKRDHEDGGANLIDGERLTFQKLADLYSEARLNEPSYRDGQKVSGLRSWQDQRRRLKTLAAFFGKRRVRAITFSDLITYKNKRLETPRIHGGGERAIATVNRELALLRSVFSFAKQSGWVVRSPFEQGKDIISTSIEAKRERVLSREEEVRLLLVCEEHARRHLRPILIAAIDTGARRGELLRLRWSDVDLVNSLMTVTSYKGKKTTTRTIGLTGRLRVELEKLWELSTHDAASLVFGIKAGFVKAFDTACRKAGIEDLRFHDLRHTALTRMVQAGMPHVEIMKLSGHSQFATFARYINTTADTARRGVEALENLTARLDREAAAATSNSYVN